MAGFRRSRPCLLTARSRCERAVLHRQQRDVLCLLFSLLLCAWEPASVHTHLTTAVAAHYRCAQCVLPVCAFMRDNCCHPRRLAVQYLGQRWRSDAVCWWTSVLFWFAALAIVSCTLAVFAVMCCCAVRDCWSLVYCGAVRVCHEAMTLAPLIIMRSRGTKSTGAKNLLCVTGLGLQLELLLSCFAGKALILLLGWAYSSLELIRLLLLMAGIESNPGPVAGKARTQDNHVPQAYMFNLHVALTQLRCQLQDTANFM